MNFKFKQILSLVICLVMMTVVFVGNAPRVAADAESDLRNEIAQLQQQSAALQAEVKKAKKNTSDKYAVVAAINKKIENTQAQINRCNQEINKINSVISANNAEIKAGEDKMNSNILDFKKRMRAIYMTDTENTAQILLGADSFSDFLQLAQLTASVNSRDKRMMEDIVAAIEALNQKNEENKKLIEEQNAVKATINEQLKLLEADEAEADSYYNQALKEQKQEEAEKAAIDAAIKAKQDDLNRFAQSNLGSFINKNTGLMWPVPYTRQITSGWGYRWGSMHRGIDISSSGIYGKAIVAIADGVVTETYNSCTHQSKTDKCTAHQKKWCGSGWGNHVKMDHGIYKGQTMGAIYAHMTHPTVSVGQRVTQGQVIGYVGSTGNSTGYHLHLSLLINGEYKDPYSYFFG